MSIIGRGYFEDGPGAWCSTKVAVRETEGGPDVYSLELHLPPVVHRQTLAWLFHSVLENVVNHRDMPSGAGGPMSSREEADRNATQKFWLVYEYGEIKAPPFAACAHLSLRELQALVFDKSDLVLEDADWEGDGVPPLSSWVRLGRSPFRVDPTRFGQ